MRWMRCPTCHQPIRWVPKPNGRRVPITVAPVPDGTSYLDADGVLRAISKRTPTDVPRYALHIPCPEERS